MGELLTRKKHRLKEYSYSNNGYYFVTVCSRNRENIFGEYNKNVGAPLACARIRLSIVGEIIDRQWNDIENQYNNIYLDQYIIMPNHIHGIIIINNRAEASAAPTIPQIIRSFKSKSTLEYVKLINNNKLNIFGKIWQRSFYDQVIRNEHSLNIIRKYITVNPINWEEDVENLLAVKVSEKGKES